MHTSPAGQIWPNITPPAIDSNTRPAAPPPTMVDSRSVFPSSDSPGSSHSTGSFDGAYIQVGRDADIFSIARNLPGIPHDTDLCQVAVELWKANPDAFHNNDMNRLKSDVQVRFPDPARVQALDKKTAQQICADQIDPYEQARHGTTGIGERKSYEDQRLLRPGESEKVFFRDYLGQIANRFDVPGVTVNQKLVALFKANPHAFNRQNMNVLKTGVMLSMPSADKVQAVDKGEADRIAGEQWLAYKTSSKKIRA